MNYCYDSQVVITATLVLMAKPWSLLFVGKSPSSYTVFVCTYTGGFVDM